MCNTNLIDLRGCHKNIDNFGWGGRQSSLFWTS